MSLISLLTVDSVWQEYLARKKALEFLPQKVIENYENFINNKKYEYIINNIVKGTYEFSIPKKVLISKMGKNKKRVVYVYNEEETYVLKLLTFLLYKYDYLFAPNLYSFRNNSGVKKAVFDITRKKQIHKQYAYKLDIENYFNSIPVETLLLDLQKDLNDKKLFELLSNILTNKKVSHNGKVFEEEKGIMAGTPISSFLANYYLKELDQYFYKNNIKYLRYSDDIIVFDNNKDILKKHRETILNFLTNKGLTINKEKEKFYSPNDKIEFLGFSFKNGIIDISENSVKKIKGKIKRTSKGLRRWMLRKKASPEATLKALNRKFNRKFYGKNENDLTWKYWFFPTINTSKSLKEIDIYMQDWQRYLITGAHNKKNYKKVPYSTLKKCNYKPLVHEYYNSKKSVL